MKKRRKVIGYLLSTIVFLTLIASIFYPTKGLNTTILNSETTKLAANIDIAKLAENMDITKLAENMDITKDYLYLSDLEYLTTDGMSANGWSGHEIQIDKNQEGGTLSLIVDGETRTFVKGIGIHAKGWITYDISEYSNRLTRFIAKIGVDASRGTNGSIWFQIYVSNDGTAWESLLKTDTMTGKTEAVDVDVDVTGYKYLKIYVDPAGSNAADHGTIGNAKLVTEDYVENDVFYDKLKKLDYYDNILKEHDAEYNYENNYRLIMDREIVNKLGYWNIQNLIEKDDSYKELFDWILSDDRIVEEVIEVGEIARPALFLEVMNNLLHTYRQDLSTQNGVVFEKMMIGLAAAYSTDKIASPLIYGHNSANYNYIDRYARVKELFLLGYFKNTEWFKEYHVEFMRSIMQDALRDDETMWFSNYIRVYKNWATGPYSYMGYVKGNFVLPAYFEEANKETFDKKFHLSEFNVPYGDSPTARYWMVFQHGGICWNLARTGQSVHKTIGIPSTGVFQPSHEAFLIYTKDSQGRGFWYLGNNNYGWGKSSTSWYGGMTYRLLFNWGKKSFVNHASMAGVGGTNAGYQYLAQANLNRYDEFKKSIYLNLAANSYTENEDKIDAYKKALESIELNLDSYDYLIRTYANTPSITKQDWKDLAEEIIEAYTYYPQAMYDLLKIIKPYLEGYDAIDISIKEREALEKASKVKNAEFWQDLAAREIANVHLGKTQPNIASFSYDGENAGKIVIDPYYENYDFQWYYSIDGGATKSSGIDEKSFKLSDEEIAKITSEEDIQIYIYGMPGNDPSYTIDIQEGIIPETLYANDLENRVVGVDLTYDWRNSESDPWTSYKTASPDNTGDKTLYVRVGATGNRLPSESRTFTFTEDNQPNTRKYVPVSHLTIQEYSTQSVDTKRPYYAPNAIDGSIYTLWHTDFSKNVLNQEVKPFITIKLDKPRYISALEFRQTKYKTNDPDDIKNARVYVSEDNENWTLAGSIENCTQYDELKVIDFDESVYGEYVKIELDTYNMFASLSLVNIFQDLSKNPRPTAGIGYSTKNPTNGNVVARLVNVSATNYEIISDGGDTHTFTENGEFTFKFIDKDTKLEGTAVAKVDWIDKEAPTATIEYSTKNPTNENVIATLKANEDVIVTNNGEYSIDDDGNVLDQDGNVILGYTADENGDITDENGNFIMNINSFTHEFIDNGEFTFTFEDRAGNKGTATAKVDWIDRVAPKATITYDINDVTNKDVTATIAFDKENVTVTNNSKKTNYVFKKNGEFTFVFKDAAGNMGSITANVNWIDKVAPTAELKYEKQGDKVIVTVVNPSKEITFKVGNGVYEYTANGNYEIVFYDSLGNVGKLIAKINAFEEENKGDENKPKNPDTSSVTQDNKTNDNIATENPDSDETDEDNIDEEEQESNTDNTSKEENNNDNTTEKLEKAPKINKVMLVVIATTISLLGLCVYVIKKIKKY